ncbi:MAG TPA: hypothetical protein VH231_03355 [Solirubrobacteraceae bacterium]|nr:hypothetical protein [Solirubrobacteraceae bacterium]
MRGLDNVTVLALAIADSDGPATLRRYRHPLTHSLYDRGPIGERRNPERGTSPIALATLALDRLIARDGLLPPGLVKLDAEGADRLR